MKKIKSKRAFDIAGAMGINCGSCIMEALYSMEIYNNGSPRLKKNQVEMFRQLVDGFFEDCPFDKLSSYIDVGRGYKRG